MRIAIVDDEEKERGRLRSYVDKFFDEKTLSHECIEFSSCLNFVSDYVEPFDIILLDIEMPHMDGMTGAKKIREIDSRAIIIFITHIVQYAVKGYEVDALDFMVKPVTQFNLEVKLNKALKRLPRRNTVVLSLSGGGELSFPRTRLAMSREVINT